MEFRVLIQPKFLNMNHRVMITPFCFLYLYPSAFPYLMYMNTSLSATCCISCSTLQKSCIFCLLLDSLSLCALSVMAYDLPKRCTDFFFLQSQSIVLYFLMNSLALFGNCNSSSFIYSCLSVPVLTPRFGNVYIIFHYFL